MKKIIIITLSFISITCAICHAGFSSAIKTISISDNYHTFILDAGHGGEDGGAVADDGTKEKDLNLSVANKIKIFFVLFGIKYKMIRTTDTSVGNNNLNTIRERKISDIHSRYATVNETDNSILVSIHMNYFTETKYSGLQVFYSPRVSESKNVAQFIQNNIKNYIQKDNFREIKPTTGSVFLLDKADNPSVLVECGFLSNIKELELLKNEIYQSKISYFITKSIFEYENAYRKGNNGT